MTDWRYWWLWLNGIAIGAASMMIFMAYGPIKTLEAAIDQQRSYIATAINLAERWRDVALAMKDDVIACNSVPIRFEQRDLRDHAKSSK